MPTSLILSQIKSAVLDVCENEASDLIEKKLKESKQKNVYDAYTPTWYDRTYEFLEANDTKVTQKNGGNNIEIEGFTPTDNQHMPSGHPSIGGSTQGQNMNDAIPHWMEYGNNNSRLYAYGGRPYIEDAEKEIEKEIEKTIIGGLKKRGIDAK